MKKLLIVALTAVFALPASADIIDYAQLWGGTTLEPDLGYGGIEYEMANGYHVGGQFGWNATPQIRVGLDLLYTEADYDCCTTALSSFSAMVAGTYYFDLGEGRFHPYAGAGLGGVQVNYLNSGPAGGSEWAFGFEVLAGVAIPTRHGFDILLGYRYQWADDVTIEGVPGIEYQSHNLSAGFLFSL